MASRCLFSSPRGSLLRIVAVLTTVVAAAAIWALTLPPRSEWPKPLGPTFWWALPVFVAALSLVLPAAMAWLHGRYVLRLEADGPRVRVTTFAWWGCRTQVLDATDLLGATIRGAGSSSAPAWRLTKRSARIDWLFDRQGDFPEGDDVLVELAGPDAVDLSR